MTGPVSRFLLSLWLALAVAVVATVAVAWAWTHVVGGGRMSVHGWIALTLGIGGTVGLTWGLMALAFRSHREGWDDRAGETPEPDREKPEA